MTICATRTSRPPTEVPSETWELLHTDAAYLVEVRVVGDDGWQVGLPVCLDYWDALMWATLLLEQIPGADATRVVPAEPREDDIAAA